MSAIDNWSAGKFKPIAMLAQTTAASAVYCHELILATRKKQFLAVSESQDFEADDWSRMYHQPRAVQGAMLHFLDSPDDARGVETAQTGMKQARQAFLTGIRQAIHDAFNSVADDYKIRRGKRWLDLYYRLVHVPMLGAMIRDDDVATSGFRSWSAQPEFIFSLAVALPCWLEYQENIWTVYGRAADGHFPSLEKILRLDPSALNDERLGRVLFRMARKSPEGHAELLQAASEGLKGQIKLVDVKFLLGGFLMQLSAEVEQLLNGVRLIQELDYRVPPHKRAEFGKWVRQVEAHAARYPIHCRLNATDIRTLFDAVAQDQGISRIDVDFQGYPNSIYKKLDRKAKLWPSLWKADKKRAA